MLELTKYARNKATFFLNKTEKTSSRLKKWSLFVLASWIALSCCIAFFTIRRTRAIEKELAEEKKKLQENEKKYRLLSDNTLDVIWIMDLNLQFTYVNPAIITLTGYSPEEWVGSRLPDHCDDQNFSLMAQIIEDEIKKGAKGTGVIFEALMVKKNGDSLLVEIRGKVIYDQNNQPASLQGTARDISDRKQAEVHIAHLNRVLRTMREMNQLIFLERDKDILIQEGCELLVKNRGYDCSLIVLTDENDRALSWARAGTAATSEALDTMLKKGELPGCCSCDREGIGPMQVESSHNASECCMTKQHTSSLSLCAPLIHEDTSFFGYLVAARGHDLTVDDEERSLFFEMAGDLAYALNVIEQDEAHKKSELRSESLEHQLVQAQKMESIGRLAGGVAHDYNNMLSVIIGYTELAQDKVDPNDPLHADLAEILSAAQRSTDITRQLLAFARQQTVVPSVLDLNEAVEGMLKMLRRLIGEDIDLAWLPEVQLWPIKIDPSQINQIMANLCVNARDAIDGVGRITIETENISFDEAYCTDHADFLPGDYTMLAVSDNGCGISSEAKDKIFEPFYTTKALGKGTGLGLSTVYGIVKQNKGFINVYSEPSQGTTIKIYLPRHAGKVAELPVESVEQIPLSRGETILLVEDEASIMKLGKKMLESLNYRVICQSSPSKAINVAEEYTDKIHLLITDVVMPEMNGLDLSNYLQSIFPDLKVLFMSGYTADVIAHQGVMEEGVCFIAKPFSKKNLALKVRGALDEITI